MYFDNAEFSPEIEEIINKSLPPPRFLSKLEIAEIAKNIFVPGVIYHDHLRRAFVSTYEAGNSLVFLPLTLSFQLSKLEKNQITFHSVIETSRIRGDSKDETYKLLARIVRVAPTRIITIQLSQEDQLYILPIPKWVKGEKIKTTVCSARELDTYLSEFMLSLEQTSVFVTF